MATWAEIKGDRIPLLRTIVGFLPLALGCFLAVLFQRMDSFVADDVMNDLALSEGTLGILTAAFLLAFVASLLPSGIAIDRFGPRAVQSVMMGVTALGALIFSLSTGPFTNAIGRALLGVGIASALLAAIKAVATWSPRERLGLVTGCFLAAAGLGALTAAGPAMQFVRAYGWGSLYIFLAFLATICAVLTALLVPARATGTDDMPDQDHGLLSVLRDPMLTRFAPLAAIVVGTVWAVQSQWIVGWIAARNGLELTDITSRISLITLGQTAGSLAWGALADWAVRKGLSAASVFVGAVALCVGIQLAAVAGILSPTAIVWGAFLVAGAAAALPFVVLLAHFPPAFAARACASVAVLQYVAALLIQSGMDFVVALWPQAASGQTAVAAYAMAFMVPIAFQFAALTWFLIGRSETRDGAQNIDEIAVALASARSAALSLAGNVQPKLRDLAQRRSATQPGHEVPGVSEPPSIPDSVPTEAAAPPPEPAARPADAATASAPAETAEALTDIPEASDSPAAEPLEAEPAEPTDIVPAPTETAEAAPAPAETVESPTETPEASDSHAARPADVEPANTAGEPTDTVAPLADTEFEPTDGLVAPGEATVAPTESALQSMLNSSLSLGLGRALDTTSRASAEPSSPAAPSSSAEVAQPAASKPSFQMIAPSHVQALNAVYRRRPALTATIGGRQISITAAWPPDRRPDPSHRLALRLDGEPGELLLPQALLDVLVGSVDPALSLDRLGPDRAAIILEFALDSVLTAVEMDLGCRLAVESFSSRVERLENDRQLPLFFTLVIEGLVTTGCELRLPADYALKLADGLDRQAGISRSTLDLPLPVCLRVAAANLAVGEIERLAPDDVVLVDAAVQPGQAAIAVIGERLVAPVALAPEGHRLAAQPITGATSPWAWTVPTDAMAPWEADAETDNRALRVLFEIGRFELPASKVKQLAPNALLPLGPLQDHAVDIVVGGQRIGRGTLMQIGNRTGVRINTVRERPRAAPGLKHAPAEEPR